MTAHTISENTAFVEPGWQLLIPRPARPPSCSRTGGRTETEVAATDEASLGRWDV